MCTYRTLAFTRLGQQTYTEVNMGHPLKDFFSALEAERKEYGLSGNKGLSADYINDLSNRYNKDLGDDKILLSNRKDFGPGGAYYSPVTHTVSMNIDKEAPSVASHEIGHAFSTGANIRGHRGSLMAAADTLGAHLPDLAGKFLFAAPGEYFGAASRGESSAIPLAVTLGGGTLLHLIGAAKRYSEEANASRLGLQALRQSIGDSSAPKLGNIFKRLVDRYRYGKLNNADRKLVASNKTLEAALRTYKVGLSLNAGASGLGSILKGTAVYGAGKLLGIDDMRQVTRGLAGLGGALNLASAIMTSQMASPELRLDPAMIEARRDEGDTDITELSTGRI
jgi:hypothetical protein